MQDMTLQDLAMADQTARPDTARHDTDKPKSNENAEPNNAGSNIDGPPFFIRLCWQGSRVMLSFSVSGHEPLQNFKMKRDCCEIE